ncbi:Hpt domain-containing protein [Lawsonibacter sp. JLR.KK007]|jgi:HPt (histidine-containing phosphotransfer) domain-containing protein|uniref:Hpt domain-containing protein n=1 Tax=Lawsonibacter sp. JLR.KK007 TaxID=3114293 RepID=UPI002FF3579B
MTMQECYAALEGDYQDVLGRLYSEALVQRFVGKFLSDQSFQLLESSLKAENYEDAFRAAHTLKGVTQNLSFTKLYHSSHAITEALRAKDYDLAKELFTQVEADYQQTAAAIQQYQGA